MTSQQFALRGEYILEDCDRIVGLERAVVFSPHSQGEICVVDIGAPDPIFHEIDDVILIRLPVPRAGRVELQLIRCSLHWFMVTRRDDDAVVLSQLNIGRVVREEDPTRFRNETPPHGRPDEVGPQTKQEVEHMLVELGVECVIRCAGSSRPPAC